MENSPKDRLVTFLKKSSEPLSIKEISDSFNEVSYPTLLKWIDIMKAEGIIKIRDYGNVKLVSIVKKNE